MTPVVAEALANARQGKREEALRVLEDAAEVLDADALAIFYLLVEEDPEPAKRVCDLALARDHSPALLSTWRLRRGRASSLLGQRDASMRDFLEVIRLAASTDQVQEANRSLLKLAAQTSG